MYRMASAIKISENEHIPIGEARINLESYIAAMGAETVGKIRKLFAEHNVAWQMGELGKVDIGGGGTVAMFMARRNIETIDAGVPVLSMHAPFEIIAKADLYMTYKAIAALYSYN
jgi:aspartyl aminopeptidase